MTRTRLGLLGLCAVVFGVMAFSAGAAQAEVGAKWLILDLTKLLDGKVDHNGPALDALNLPAFIDIREIENNTAALLTKIIGVSVEILCTAAKLIGVKLEANGSLTNGGKVKFTGCVVFLNGVLNKSCEAHSTGSPLGTIETLAGKGLIVLHELVGGVKDTLIRIEPSVGETFVTINMGAECPIGENIPIKGKLFLKDCQNEFLVHKVIHLVEQGPLTHVFIISDTAEHVAAVDGSFLWFLTGAHEGYLWGGDPA